MTPDTSFNYGVVSPVECLNAGWAAIKDRYWLFLGITLVATLLGGAVPIVLIGPMMCRSFMCLIAQMRGITSEFGLLFNDFDHFTTVRVRAAVKIVPVLAFG